MRTIKFRAWHEFANQMLTSSYQSDVLRWKEEGQPVIIMQFTGLHDKNGREIYEGDFLISPFTGDPAPVIYDQEYCQFTFGGAEFNVEVKHKKLEVIGNIYENPELL